jgi:hypothetical protein
MAIGRIPGLRIDRSGIAMLVASGAIPVGEIAGAIHFPTLHGALRARVGAAGVYDLAAVWISRQAGRPLWLLALTGHHLCAFGQ